MELAMVAFVVLLTSLWLCGLTIKVAKALKLGADESEGAQKIHSHWVPRLGGVPIFVAYVVGLLLLAWQTASFEKETAFLIVCLLPAFGIGLLEDVTRRAGILPRLIFTMIAAALGWWLLDASMYRTDIPWLDMVLANYSAVAFVVTVVAAAGFAHAINIVDGCNGLSSFVSALVLFCLALVAGWVGDTLLMRVGFLGAAAVAGFFIWNFPFGKIFLGDAGAYMVGFLIAEVAIMLVARNPEVSAWFPMLLLIYPVWETLFSMIRRAQFGLSQMSQPDSLHLHQLVYRRVVRHLRMSKLPLHKVLRNSISSMYIWALSTLCAIPAVIFYDDTPLLAACCVLFVLSYIAIYRAIIRFRTPKMLVLKKRKGGIPMDPELQRSTERG